MIWLDSLQKQLFSLRKTKRIQEQEHKTPLKKGFQVCKTLQLISIAEERKLILA